MSKKVGMTMMSLVVYVVLLAVFTGIALTVSNNLSSSVFLDKGIAQNTTNYEKVLYYLNKSAMESASATVTTTAITFSNGDVFSFDTSKGRLYMNSGVLCNTVSEFDIGNIENNLVNIDITLAKYTNTMTRTITLYVGE